MNNQAKQDSNIKDDSESVENITHADAQDANAEAQKARSAHVASNISSSMSGNVVGDMVGNKRMGLLDAMYDAEPQIGRRPTPITDPWPRRKMYIRGISLSLLVCIIVAVLLIVFAQQDAFAANLL